MKQMLRCIAPVVAALGLLPVAQGQAAPLAMTPPMGWNSWNHFNHNVTDADVRAAADAMVASGMRDMGYVYVNIDDTWEGERDAHGELHSNAKFPDMKALADYVHSKGLKLGIYSSPGPQTCAHFAASYGHEQQDADTFAKWGIDYLKYDLCGLRIIMRQQAPNDPAAAHKIMVDAYEKMHQALVNTHRSIVYSLCQYGEDNVWEWGASVGGNLWRTTGDVQDDYNSVANIGFGQAGLAKFAGPGHWNDPDMLEVGNGQMKPDEYRTQMGLWAILAAPLLAGNDLSRMDDVTKSILMNRDIIAIDQDPLGMQGDRVRELGPQELWMRPLSNGMRAVGLFNRGNGPATMTVDFKEVGFHGAVYARDAWAQKDLGRLQGSYTAVVPRHGVVVLLVSSKPLPAR